MRRLNLGEEVYLQRGVKWEMGENDLYTEYIEYTGISRIGDKPFFGLSLHRKSSSPLYRGGDVPVSFHFALPFNLVLPERIVFVGDYSIQITDEPLYDAIPVRYIGQKSQEKITTKWGSMSHREHFVPRK